MIFYPAASPIHLYSKALSSFIISLLFFLFTSSSLNAQFLYEIDGTVTTGSKKLDGAVVTLFKGGTQVKQVSTPSNGKFSISLDQESEYTMTVTKPGFITKKFVFSTKGMPTDIAKNYEGGAKPEISIFEIPKDPAVVSQVNSILAQPMAKFIYDPTEQDIVFDKAYSESMLQELNRLSQLEKEVKKKQEEEEKNKQAGVAAVEGHYKEVIAKADAAFGKKDYATARAGYQDALTIKRAEPYPLGKISEIDKLLADASKNSQLEADYKAAIAKGDASFGSKSYDAAKSSYTDALKLKPAESYPKSKLDEIDKLLTSESKNKELDAKYNAVIAAADKAFGAKTYDAAKTSYTEALALKSSEKYPKAQLNEIDRLITEQNNKNKSAAELLEKYKAAIAKADASLKDKAYDDAKKAYKDALSYKPQEQYPKEKLQEIDNLLAKEAGAKELDQRYAAVISKADKALGAKDYAAAKSGYNEALTIKSAELYPKARLAEIDKAMADLAKASADKDRLSKEKELNDRYLAIVAKADKAMGNKDYTAAKAGYNEALGVKSMEQYPRIKIVEIDKLLAEMVSKEAAEKDRLAKDKAANEKYAAAIAKGDAAFTAKDYSNSKNAYIEAANYKPSEKYPIERIQAIDALLAANAKEQEQRYKTALAKADAAYAGKDYVNAKSAYTEASSIKSTEVYPKDQIAKIDQLLAEANKEKDLKAKYTTAIAAGDAAMLKKDYTAALASFKDAQTLKPAEPYPNNKISEIKRITDELARGKEKEKQYADIIAKADKLLAAKDYKNAKSAYLDASIIKPTEQYPKDKTREIDNILNPKTVVTPTADTKSKDDFRNELAKKYPQGITEESAMEGNLKVVRRIVVSGSEAHLYLKKMTSFGAIYYFKDDVSITEAEFVRDTEAKK
ncbi:MAG TPA: hypothetical protein VFF27_13545 [Bacteroidia bacterium]|jgi:hypothetical protein|nr:hypothetical protein [Bacteroidia bacterium]